ncbi:hypothetical protein NSQ43_14595 [Sporosarcina sp. FSL W8-0480]|uniref:hypothetical protein n=1 Tax=Sporosarcina sp. FSL W8-0480 TaxID=2954701 RepID=UPI0030DD6A90
MSNHNDLKEMLQSVIHEALQPLHERLDKVDEKLDSISAQVAENTESIVGIKEQLTTNNESANQVKSIIAQVDALTLDVKVLKKAIAN